jgi:general secretion pathway protein G
MKKQAMTLMEIMIVILLIGMVLSVIGINMKGSLDKGRAFKTEQAQSQIIDVLTLEMANGNIPESYSENEIVRILENSGMVKNPKSLIKDGWNDTMQVSYNEETGKIEVVSKKLDAYKEKKEKDEPLQEE